MEIQKKISLLKPEVHEKGWGKEVWVINFPYYCMKFLHFKKGKRGSMHFHVDKHETWYIQEGKLKVTSINTEDASNTHFILVKGDVIDIPILNPHQVEALEDSIIVEVSTQHFEDDSYRVLPGDSQNKK